MGEELIGMPAFWTLWEVCTLCDGHFEPLHSSGDPQPQGLHHVCQPNLSALCRHRYMSIALYGIEAFTTTTKPFNVTFKGQVEDFQVIEIGLDGTEACITDTTTIPVAPTQPTVGGADEGGNQTGASSSSSSKCQFVAPLESLLTEAQVLEVSSLAEKALGDITLDDKCCLGAVEDKNKRVAVFSTIKQKWPFLTTKTLTIEGVHMLHVQADWHYLQLRPFLSHGDLNLLLLFASDCVPSQPKSICVAPGNSKEMRTKLHHEIAKCYPFLHTKTIESSGEQRISVFKSPKVERNRKRKLDAMSSSGTQWLQFVLEKRNIETMDSLVRLVSFCRAQSSAFSIAGIKDKRGITTQFFTACAASISPKKLLSLNTTSMPIRVGNLKYVKQPLSNGQLLGNRFIVVLRDIQQERIEVEDALQAVQRCGFTNYYGPQRFGDDKFEVQTYTVGQLILQRKWKEAVHRIMQPDSQSTKDVRLAKEHWVKTEDHQAVIKMLPPHRQTELQVLKGLNRYKGLEDMHEKALMNIPHTMRTLMLHSYCSYVWNRAATERVRRYGLKVVEGDLVTKDAEGELVGDEHAPSAGSDGIVRFVPHVVSSEEAASSAFSIKQLLLPMPGKHTVLPQNDIKNVYEEQFAEDGITMDIFAQKVVQVALPGTYRKVINFPLDLTYEWLEEKADGSDCAKSAPPDAQTSDNANGVGQHPASTDAPRPEACLMSESDPSVGLQETKAPDFCGGHLLRLGFGLKPAAYATIFLREVTKTMV